MFLLHNLYPKKFAAQVHKTSTEDTAFGFLFPALINEIYREKNSV